MMVLVKSPLAAWSLLLLSLGALDRTHGHGLMEKPPSRNQYCGVITKPDQVNSGNALYPECGDAFAFTGEGGYWFMSVLTHDTGRASVTPLPQHVCGFDSETWSGGATPWDATGVDWPMTPMSSGPNEIWWNIEWGPHFDDTEEFRYWITKPDFVYDSSRKLEWDDFDDDPFCVEFYNHADKYGNPNIVPWEATAQFQTFCTVPTRSGRHIIYGEWGRNFFTYERFHGCIDVKFDGSNSGSPLTRASIVSDVSDGATIVGSGTVTLDASGSSGDSVSYFWSISTMGDDTIYNITDPFAATTTLTLAEPSSAQSVMITLLVKNANGISTDHFSLVHTTFSGSLWNDLGPLTDTPGHLQEGTQLTVRTVTSDGTDAYYPSPPLTITSSNRWADNWPFHLAQAISNDAPIIIGEVDGNDNVIAQWSATNNCIYGKYSSDVVFASLTFGSSPATPLPSPAPVTNSPTGPPVLTTTAPTPAPVISTTGPTPAPVVSTSLPVVTPSGDCVMIKQDGANSWFAGLLVGFDTPDATLNFADTGLDLNTVTFQQGVGERSRHSTTLILGRQTLKNTK